MPDPHADEPAGLPVVRVALLAHERREAVRTTLRRMLREGGYPADRLDGVVVDNASTDGTAAMVRAEFPEVRVIASGANEGAPGWNRAIPGGDYDWLLLLDDDCFLEPGDLERGVRAAAARDAGLVSFRVRSSEGGGRRFDEAFPTGLLSYWGCAALLSRAAAERLGGYDPRIFIWGNELDLTLRLLDAGFRHLHLPGIVAVHMKPVPPPGARPAPRARDLHARHTGYAVGRLLRPLDAVRVAGRLALATALDALAPSGAAGDLAALGPLTRGLADGARHRRPVRPAVSAAARDNFPPFANPLQFLRPPAERLRAPRPPVDRHARFRARRPGFFPADAATLEL